MSKVNPPPQLRIPKEFQNNIEIRNFFEQQQTILFQLWQKTGGASDNIANSFELDGLMYNTQVQQILKRLDGLPEFTIDTTGFTTDTTLITSDKVIA